MTELPAHQLEAFFAIVTAGTFSSAARALHVSQPALSQRLKELEERLKSRLLLRGAGGVELTDAGARLLRFCQTERALRAELAADLGLGPSGPHLPLTGSVRVWGFSSIIRSAALPALAPLLRKNPLLAVEVCSREMGEIRVAMVRGAAEFAILDEPLDRPDLEHTRVGFEELVLVESARHRARDDVYLDHDADDLTTLRFLKRAGLARAHVRRAFLDDIYGVLDGVALGMGRAVVPRHLLEGVSGIRVVEGTPTTRSPVLLHWARQPTFTRAHNAVREVLLEGLIQTLAA